MDFKITPAAAKRISYLMSKKDSGDIVGLRISVDGGGCSGFMYQYDFIDSINEDDYVVENQSVKVIIDPISQEFLDGCSIEFIEELGSNYFQITNPNATAKCGCGNSFAV
ncbi:MAG: iron-sulfur cluster insertion protein ErpA [Rickettsiaceae bacterium]|nr:iron-sulfur cluster insertion protein ErpA [Rickettsiaceae bacterium]